MGDQVMVHAQCHQQRQDLKKAQKDKEYLHVLSHCTLDCAVCKLILTQMVAIDSVRDVYLLVI